MKYLTHLIALGFGIIIGFGIKGCSTNPCEPCPEVKEGTEIRIDTVYLEAAVTKPAYKPKPSKVKSADSILKKPAVYFYEDSLIDSNLAIFITDTAAGEILGRGIKYKLKVPLQIKETITTTRIVEKPVQERALYLGVEAGTNLNSFRIAPAVEYLTKKGYAYSYSYDVLNSVHSVGFKRKLKL